jgi:ABC-type molybdate transport system substrate-binding protein
MTEPNLRTSNLPAPDLPTLVPCPDATARDPAAQPPVLQPSGQGRRRLLGGLAALPLVPLLSPLLAPLVAPLVAVAASRPARADVSRSPDVVVFCDPTLRDVLHRLGAAFLRDGGAPLRLICAPAAIIAAQIARSERNDVVMTLEPVVQRMVASQLVDAEAGVGVWRNRVTVAGAATPADPPAGPAVAAAVRPSLDRLPTLLGDGRLGAPDPTSNAVFDTPALLRRLGLEAALAGRVVGEADTGGVAFLLRRGTVRLGLVLRTDARAGGLAERLDVPDDAYPPIRYAAARNRHAMSRNTERFLAFLAAQPARDGLAQDGLEIVA